MGEEETIRILEEIDSKFSRINRTLKNISSKIEHIKKLNKENIENVKPWIDFFDIQKQEPSNAVEEEFASSLEEFDIEMLPTIFRQDGQIENVYNTIKNRGRVQIQKLIGMYEESEREKILVFIDLLVKKRFIRHQNDCLYC